MVPFVAGQSVGDVFRVVDCDDIIPVSDVTYVDDLCLVVSAEKPNGLIERPAEMIRVCRRALAKHGLLMNFSNGKTECILRPFGDGSQDLMACLQRVDDQRVTTVDDVVVRVVIVQALGHDPQRHGQYDGEGQSESQSDDGCISRACGTGLWLSKIVTPDQVAAGGLAVVVQPSLCHGDLEHVHANGVEVLQHGLHA